MEYEVTRIFGSSVLLIDFWSLAILQRSSSSSSSSSRKTVENKFYDIIALLGEGLHDCSWWEAQVDNMMIERVGRVVD